MTNKIKRCLVELMEFLITNKIKFELKNNNKDSIIIFRICYLDGERCLDYDVEFYNEYLNIVIYENNLKIDKYVYDDHNIFMKKLNYDYIYLEHDDSCTTSLLFYSSFNILKTLICNNHSFESIKDLYDINYLKVKITVPVFSTEYSPNYSDYLDSYRYSIYYSGTSSSAIYNNISSSYNHESIKAHFESIKIFVESSNGLVYVIIENNVGVDKLIIDHKNLVSQVEKINNTLKGICNSDNVYINNWGYLMSERDISIYDE